MRLITRISRLSLRLQLIASYLVILGTGGLATSLIGSWIVSSTILHQAQRTVTNHLGTARFCLETELRDLERDLTLTAEAHSRDTLPSAAPSPGLWEHLERLRTERGYDFLGLTDAAGRLVWRAGEAGVGFRGDRMPDGAAFRFTPMESTEARVPVTLPVVHRARAGTAAAAVALLTPQDLAREALALPDQVRVPIRATPHASRPSRQVEGRGLAFTAAAPIRDENRQTVAVIYAGRVLNRRHDLVDRVWEIAYRSENLSDPNAGSVTIFLEDVRISTTARDPSGERAVGTLVSDEVRRTVLDGGLTWAHRSFVIQNWFLSAYDPLRDLDGNIVGMLFVGIREDLFLSIRNRVIASFFAIAGLGFILILAVTYRITASITHPVDQMVAATRSIAAGRFEPDVDVEAHGELRLLVDSFNSMLESLRRMRHDLEEWGATLEQKVKERSEELGAMQSRVAQAERLASVGRLAAGVAHEINNPLGGILALTALTLEDTPEADPNRENLEEVLRQSERCRDIVRGLLEFSRQSEVNWESLDLSRLVTDTLSLLARQSMFFNIELAHNLDPELPTVEGDKSQLQQVFMNILMNAVQAMNERGTLTVLTRGVNRGREVEVVVRDTGCGIPEDKLSRIFDPFFTTKTEGKGTGLGLSIAYGIVSRHRGTIAVSSDVGRGSEFIVRLPAQAGEGATEGLLSGKAFDGETSPPANSPGSRPQDDRK